MCDERAGGRGALSPHISQTMLQSSPPRDPGRYPRRAKHRSRCPGYGWASHLQGTTRGPEKGNSEWAEWAIWGAVAFRYKVNRFSIMEFLMENFIFVLLLLLLSSILCNLVVHWCQFLSSLLIFFWVYTESDLKNVSFYKTSRIPFLL